MRISDWSSDVCSSDLLEAKQARMKAANAAIRKHRKAGPTAQIAALVELGFGPSAAPALIEPDCCGRIGFPDYALQNTTANIRLPHARNPPGDAIQHADAAPERVRAPEPLRTGSRG